MNDRRFPPAARRRPIAPPGRRRLASALLIVVMLVLLLAIVGTAFVSTTSTDRTSAYQFADNAQVDLFVDGVIGMVRGALVNDLFGEGHLSSIFMPSDGKPISTAYPSIIGQQASRGKWLASRVPTYELPNPGDTRPRTPFDGYTWSNVTLLPHLESEQNATGNGYRDFVSPLTNAPVSDYPADKKIMSFDEGGVDYPAHKATYRSSVINWAVADADGDGIGDAGYFPLTYQPRNGVTYLAGVRIVDNCAAINVNTAWSRDEDFDAAGNPKNHGYYRSGVGLKELLAAVSRPGGGADPAAELAAINFHRFGGTNAAQTDVVTDGGGQRFDFRWDTQGDALTSNLTYRFLNPGWNGGLRYRPFTDLDDTALAYRYLLVNPEVAPTPLEDAFLSVDGTDALFRSASNYAANSRNIWREFARAKDANGDPTETHLQLIQRWFGQNFDFENGRFSLRPLLVANNPVSRFTRHARVYDKIKTHTYYEFPRTANPGMLPYRSGGEWSSGATYKLHDLVRYRDRYYASLKDDNAAEPSGTDKSDSSWDYQPWRQTPEKACLNTGTFRDLWRSFWSTIMLTDGGTVDEPDVQNSGTSAAKGAEFWWSPRRVVTLEGRPTPTQEMIQLRSALAAVNTMGMRDQRRDVISRTIDLYYLAGPPDVTYPDRRRYGQTTYKANVFSHEWQPVISEVIVDTGANGGYMAVELYNPYPVKIRMKNWHFAKVKRAATGITQIEDLGEVSSSGVISIPAGGLVVLESGVRPNDIGQSMPTDGDGNPTAKIGSLPGLYKAVEDAAVLMLVRPRRQDGTLSANQSPIDNYDEGTDAAPNIQDFVPLDQMDFAAFAPPVAGDPPPPARYRYARNTAEPEKWQFYFPGYYNPTMPAADGMGYHGFRQVADSEADYAGGLGRNDASTYTRTCNLKLHHWDWPGKSRLGGMTNRTPYGMFARVGDVLRVPMIGSYTIWRDGRTVDMVSITADAAYCDADKVANAANKPLPVPANLGRFVPERTDERNEGPTGGYVYTGGLHRSHYSMNVLEMFCVRKPESDFLPNIPEDMYGFYKSGDPSDPDAPDIWVNRTETPLPVANSDAGYANVNERLTGEQGLVNINTAPWQVLAQLPLVVNPDGSVNKDATIECAKAIAATRETRTTGSPFSRRANYRRVFEACTDLLRSATGNDDDTYYNVPKDDWEYRYESIMRLSNLITARSDSFTVYIVVEGWRDCYTPEAKKVLQRRVAFIADRSAVTEENRELRITNVPQ